MIPGTIVQDKNIMLRLFLLALIVRIIFVFFFEQFPVAYDDLQYNVIAKNMLDGNGFSYDSVKPTASRGPAYPLFLAAAYFIFGYDYNVARILQALIGALTCLIVYLIAKKLYGDKTAFYAMLVTGLYPSLIGYTGLLYSETLAAFFLSLVIFVFLAAKEKKSLRLFVITGIFSGFLILCYPKFIFLPIILGFSAYFFNEHKQNNGKYFLSLVIAAALVIVPWTLRNFNVFGKWIPVSTGVGTTLWYSTLPGDYTEWHFDKEPIRSELKKFFPKAQKGREQEEFIFSVKTNDVFAKKAFSNIRSNPLLFIKLSVRRFFRQWFASNGNSFYALRKGTKECFSDKDYGRFCIKIFLLILHISAIFLAWLGIYTDLRSNKKKVFSPVLLSIFYLTVINSVFMTQTRYQIPVLGLMLIYSVLGARRVFSEFSGIRNKWKINP